MNDNFNYKYDNVIQLDENSASKKFMANVFLWMFVALGISASCSYAFATVPALQEILFSPGPDGGLHITGLGILAMLSPLLFVLTLRYGVNRISYGVLAVIFLAYASVSGISLSILFAIYTIPSILSVFVIAAVVFAIMAIAGYTTNQDLTKFGPLLIMAVVGLVVASLINMFMHSEALYYLIGYIGVAVFVGLTAYDVQKLKRISEGLEYGDATAKKMALMGALTLYLDFVNLFIYLLRIFGRRR